MPKTSWGGRIIKLENSNHGIHHEIIMHASLLITNKLIESKEAIPLLSFKYARILIVTQICTTQVQMEQKIKKNAEKTC